MENRIPEKDTGGAAPGEGEGKAHEARDERKKGWDVYSNPARNVSEEGKKGYAARMHRIFQSSFRFILVEGWLGYLISR